MTRYSNPFFIHSSAICSKVLSPSLHLLWLWMMAFTSSGWISVPNFLLFAFSIIEAVSLMNAGITEIFACVNTESSPISFPEYFTEGKELWKALRKSSEQEVVNNLSSIIPCPVCNRSFKPFFSLYKIVFSFSSNSSGGCAVWNLGFMASLFSRTTNSISSIVSACLL